jgi:DNA polymerase III epsilon subunit-like protein
VYSKNLWKLKPKIQEVIDSFENGVTAYNNAFDFGFLESRGFNFPKKLGCPMLLSTNICKIPHSRGSGFKWPNVEEAYKFFTGKTDFIEKHRGADDALHEAEIIHHLYKLGIFKLK